MSHLIDHLLLVDWLHDALTPSESRRRDVSFVSGEIMVRLHLATATGELSLFSTVTTFGTAVDITASELSTEAFFPADASTAEGLTSAIAVG